MLLSATTDQKSPLKADPDWSISRLIEEIMNEWPRSFGEAPGSDDQIRLIHRGRVLEKDSQLGDYDIHENAFIHVSVRPIDLDTEEYVSKQHSTKRSCGCVII